jgi:glycosyltransferase involved in cell wall biosynthesis
MTFIPQETAVLHVALNPVTGVWSVMRELSRAQVRSEKYAAVGVGVIADSSWPALYAEELQNSGSPHYLTRTPKMFGTAQFLWQRVQRPPIDEWVDDLLSRSGAKFCVVHFHNAWLSGIFLPLKCVRQGRARAVATFHGVNANFQNQPMRKKIHQWISSRLLRHQAILTSVDKGNLVRAATLLQLDAKHFTVIPNGIADAPMRVRPKRDRAATFNLGHIGSIMPAKGWQILVAAAEKLHAAGLPVKVVLAGRGDEAELAQKIARDSGGWITFAGFVANPRETILPELDALVLMSEQEGLPMAIVEAMSVGLPVIATAVGGVPEALIHEKNGLLVSRTVEALVHAVKRLIEDVEFHENLCSQARRNFEARFEISKIVARYAAVYAGAV